jgi:excisionase family DNA binding protein
MPDSIPQLLPLLAVAKALNVSPHTVRSWVRKGKLRPVRLCRRLLFDRADLLSLVAEAKTASSGCSGHES